MPRFLRARGFVSSISATQAIEGDDVLKEPRAGDIVQRFVKPCEIVRGFLADLGDGERMQPARKRELAGAFDGIQEFPGVLLAENARLRLCPKIECGKGVKLELERHPAAPRQGRAPRVCRRRFRQARRGRAHRAWRSIRGGGSSARGTADSRIPKPRIADLFARGFRTQDSARQDATEKSNGLVSAGRISGTTPTTAGITSPAFSMTTVSPMRISLR